KCIWSRSPLRILRSLMSSSPTYSAVALSPGVRSSILSPGKGTNVSRTWDVQYPLHRRYSTRQFTPTAGNLTLTDTSMTRTQKQVTRTFPTQKRSEPPKLPMNSPTCSENNSGLITGTVDMFQCLRRNSFRTLMVSIVIAILSQLLVSAPVISAHADE